MAVDHHGSEIPAPKHSRDELIDKVHPWTKQSRKDRDVKAWLKEKDRSDYGFDSYGNPDYAPNYWQDQKPAEAWPGFDDPDKLDLDDALSDPEWHKREVPEIRP